MEKTVFQGQIIQVTQQQIGDITWERAYLPDGVIAFPMNEEGQILMVEEKRPHESPPIRIKPVSGILESERGSPEENLQQEMQEEVGYKARELALFMTLKGSGTVTHTQYFFVARELIPSKLPNPDGEDTIMGLRWYTPDELLDAYLQDQIKWSFSTLGFFKLYHLLKSDKFLDLRFAPQT